MKYAGYPKLYEIILNFYTHQTIELNYNYKIILRFMIWSWLGNIITIIKTAIPY